MELKFESDHRIALCGRLGEQSGLLGLLPKLRGIVTLDLSGLARINSDGAREWLVFVRQVPAEVTLVLERCSVAFVTQLNMIDGFAGRATVKSVFVPYLCTKCEQPTERLVEVAAAARGLPAATCACGGALEPDVAPEQFFSFAT